jgi:hypothetical protein
MERSYAFYIVDLSAPSLLSGTTQVLLTNAREDMNTYWRLSPLERRHQVVNTPPISTTTTVTTPATITTTITPTTMTITTTVTRTVAGDV